MSQTTPDTNRNTRTDRYRFGEFQRRAGGKHREFSFNVLTPRLERDAEGNLIPYRTPRFKLSATEVYNLLRPYISVRMKEQMRAVIPLALSGLINWTAAGTVLIGALVGGYLGARLTQIVPERALRAVVAGLGVVLTASFLLR